MSNVNLKSSVENVGEWTTQIIHFVGGEKRTFSNIESETFEGDIGQQRVSMDPSVNRYVQAISKTVKK